MRILMEVRFELRNLQFGKDIDHRDERDDIVPCQAVFERG